MEIRLGIFLTHYFLINYLINQIIFHKKFIFQVYNILVSVKNKYIFKMNKKTVLYGQCSCSMKR